MPAPFALLDAALRLVAEARIREAEAEGRLDDLPGAGKPIPGDDEPYDPDWWLKQWLQRGDARRAPGGA